MPFGYDQLVEVGLHPPQEFLIAVADDHRVAGSLQAQSTGSNICTVTLAGMGIRATSNSTPASTAPASPSTFSSVRPRACIAAGSTANPELGAQIDRLRANQQLRSQR